MVSRPLDVMANTMEQRIQHVADLILNGTLKRIAVLCGAGISVGSGIPDFRSPRGMYDTLRPNLLTASDADREAMVEDPTWVVNKELFMRNSLPYLEVRRPFIIGTAKRQWRPSLSHMFLRVCYDKGLLHRVYTQNIDGLDFATGVPTDRIIPLCTDRLAL
jgi:NAD-dependent SIR2 family protein deacetylase